MAEFQTVVKEYRRLCGATEYCIRCPLMELVKSEMCCEAGVLRRPEESERIIMDWAKAHPIKTNRDKFKEVFGLDYLDPLPGGGSAWLSAEYKGGQDEQN